MPETGTHTGELPSGSVYAVEVPDSWNGTLLLHSHPAPVPEGQPPWTADDHLVHHLVGQGYAVAGSANTMFWPLELVFSDHPALLDEATRILGPPQLTIASGVSIGGIISAGRVQLFPEDLSGALPMCGNLAGAVGIHNRELDIAFVFKTLLASDSDLRLVDIAEPGVNLRLARTLLEEAQTSPAGRARLALAAAMGDIPGWHDAESPEPAADDFEARQRNQHAWFEHISFLVYFWAREQVERQAGGNASWNTGIDYRGRLASSINRDQVEALYDMASLDLDGDLDRLASEPRVEADPGAVGYLERHMVFDGHLKDLPVLTVHTIGDGLVTPDNQHAYADVVHHAGDDELLRQIYVHRGGHSTFTPAEVLTALQVLRHRIEDGTWPDIEPRSLNDTALVLGPEQHVLESGRAVVPAFSDFEPTPFPRPYDARHTLDEVTEARRHG